MCSISFFSQLPRKKCVNRIFWNLLNSQMNLLAFIFSPFYFIFDEWNVFCLDRKRWITNVSFGIVKMVKLKYDERSNSVSDLSKVLNLFFQTLAYVFIIQPIINTNHNFKRIEFFFVGYIHLLFFCLYTKPYSIY